MDDILKKWPLWEGKLTAPLLPNTQCCLYMLLSLAKKYICSCQLWYTTARTTDTQWRQKSKKSENFGRCGRQNMLPPYLRIWDWDWIFGRAVKAIFSPGVRSPCTTVTYVRCLQGFSFFPWKLSTKQQHW